MKILAISFSGVESAGIRKLTSVVADAHPDWELTDAEAQRLAALGAPTPGIPFTVAEREADLHDIFRLVNQTSYDDYARAGLTEKQGDALADLATEMEDAFGFDALLPYEARR